MKFIDDENKKLNWFTKNYFYAATALIILVNILLFGTCGSRWETDITFSNRFFNNFMRSLFNCYSHANWQHVLLNMLCFLVAGLYLERKTGSIKLLILVVFLSFFSSMATITAHVSVYMHGFSNVNYAIYGFIIIEYYSSLITSIIKNKNDLFNIIFGAVVVGLIVLAFFFNGGTATFSFASYPYDLMQAVHWPGFIVGAMTALLLLIPWKNTKDAL